MTIKEAATTLRDWQAKIIHGPNVFGEIADAIDKQQRIITVATDTLKDYADKTDSGKMTSYWAASQLELIERILSEP